MNLICELFICICLFDYLNLKFVTCLEGVPEAWLGEHSMYCLVYHVCVGLRLLLP